MKPSHLFTVLAVVLVVGAFALRIWLGNRGLAEQQRQIEEQERLLEEQKRVLDTQLKEMAKQSEARPYMLRFQNIVNAYGQAGLKLGRPPRGPTS